MNTSYRRCTICGCVQRKMSGRWKVIDPPRRSAGPHRHRFVAGS